MPSGTATVVLTAPVVGVSPMPVVQVPYFATVALPDAPSVAGTPFTESLAAMLAIGRDAMPKSAVPLWAIAMT